MFTRNFYKYLAGYFVGSTGFSNIEYTTHAGKQPRDTLYSGNVNGYEPNPYNIMAALKQPKSKALSNDHVVGSSATGIGLDNYNVFFGDGTTEPTIDDYTLSGEFITGITTSYTFDISANDDGSGSAATVKYTITNNNEEAITISEIGIFTSIYWQSSSSTSSKYTSAAILAERTLLETPITIEPGGVGQIAYTITFKTLN